MSTIWDRLEIQKKSSNNTNRSNIWKNLNLPRPVKDQASNFNQNFEKNTSKEENKKTWFNSGAFDDGYQFGDILKTALGTTADVASNLTQGVVRAGESIGDLAAYAGAQVIDWFGNENYANQVRQAAAEDLTGKVFSGANKFLDNYSLLGDKSQDVVSSIGNMYAQGITSGKLLGAKGNVPFKIGGRTFNLPVTSLVQGASGGLSEAYQKGAEDWQAWLNGAGSGLAEGISESLFGTFGIGGSDLDDAIVKSVTKKMKSSLAKNLAKVGIKSLGEGTEEVASYLLNYASGNAIDFIKNTTGLKGKDIANEFNSEELWDNFIGGALAAGIGGLPSTIRTIKGSQQNLDATEGVSQFNLPTEQQTTKENIPSETTVEEMVKQDQSNLQPIETINLPKTKFQYEKSDNANINALNESMAKYFDNSQKTKDLSNTISKIIQDKNYLVVFDNTLKNKSGNLVNAQISTNNGKTEIKINPNSPRAVEFLMVHEITHNIETDSMKQLVMDYASKNAEFNQALENLKQTYGVDDVSSEVVADISGQLFGNQEFINNLSTEKPNLFKRIYNKIVEIANKITGNSNEALFIRDLKQKWENAYRTSEQVKQGTTYSQENNLSLEQRLSGDKLLDAQDFIDEIKSVGAEVDKNGYVTVYHQTTEENAKKIIESGKMLSKELAVFFSTNKQAQQSEGRGNVKLEFKIPAEKLILDDVFSDNADVKIPLNNSKYLDVSKYLINESNKHSQQPTTDSQGRELSPQQQEYFKDSKVRDENGKLLEVYHGTPYEFNVFNYNKLGENTSSLGAGFYFTDNETTGNEYSRGNYLKKVYLDIKKPMKYGKTTITKNEYKKFVEAIDKKTNGVYLEDYDGIENALMEYEYGGDDIDLINAIHNASGLSWNEIYSLLRETIGYDGIISEKGFLNENETIYVVFNSNQIKNVDNLNPTTNEDIRYSSDNQTWQQYLEDNYQATGTRTYMENIKLEEVPYVEDNNNLSEFENKELSILQNLPFELGQEEISRLNYLEAKKEGRIKFPELKNNITFEDIKEKYSKYKNLNKFDNSLLESAKSFVPGYRNTEKRTKNEWLQIANLIGTNFKGNSSQNLEKYAIQSWFASQPNQKDNLNRQGSKYVKFTITEWVNEVYKGAEVGQLIENKPNLPLNTSNNNNLEKTTSINLPTQEEISVKTTEKLLNPNEISQLTKEDANTTPILPTKNVEKGKGKSNFAKNIQDKTNMLTEESKQTITSDKDVNFYREVTNEESLNKAFEKLNKGGASETQRWFAQASDKSTSVDIAEGWILLKQYQDKIAKTSDLNEKNELNRSMVQVAKKMREMGTKAGQTVQAFNIMNRLTPEGMVYYAQSELDEAFNQMIKNKSKEWIDKYKEDFVLTPEETQFIMDTMQEISTMDDGYNKKVKLAEIQKLMTDKLPPERGASMKAWMRISMLFNPKTQVRNVAGNAIIAPVNWFGDLVGSAIDTQIAKKTGVRTKGGSLKGYGKGFKEGLFQSYNDFKKGINTRNIEGNRFEISQGKSFNNKTLIGKTLNKVDSLLSFMLDAGDRAFYEAEFTRSINNQMVLNNTNEVTKDMVDIATNEALQRTWQDNNEYTKFVLNVRNSLNKINVKGYGLGDILIPFAKTPANLTKALIDYSPAGLIPAINKGIKLKRSLANGQYTPKIQNDFVNQLGKATAGTMLYILGTALAKAGVTSGESDEDKDVSNFLKNTLGINSYSIKFGNTSFTYDWAQPIAGAFAITANIQQKKKDGAELHENILSSLDTAGSILLEQSFLESINTVLNNNDGFVSGLQEAVLDLPARAIPTLSSQIASLIDPTVRTSFEYDKPIESMVNSIKAKIPGLSQTLAPSVDTLGREIQRYGGKNNIFNVFLNPANVSTENISESAKEIYSLYKETGNTNIMPRVAPYYINKNGEKIALSSSERAKYQKASGDIIETEIENLLNNNQYKKLSKDKKAEVISDIINYSYNVAQKEVLGTELSDTYQKVFEYSKIGDVSDYYSFKNSVDDTNKDTKKDSVTKYLLNSNLSDKELSVLYGSYYSSEETLKNIMTLNIPIKEYIKLDSQEFTTDYNDNGKAITNSKKNKLINYVNSLNLSIPQKAILIKSEYSSYDSYNKQIVNYVNSQNLSKFDKATLLKNIGFNDYDDYIVEEVNSRNISVKEKEEILKDLGFKVINGRVYK